MMGLPKAQQVKFHNPADVLHNLICDNGGHVIKRELYRDYKLVDGELISSPARDITYEIPIHWTISMFFPRETVKKKLRKHLDFDSKNKLIFIVPTKEGRYGVFLVRKNKAMGAYDEVRKIEKLLKKSKWEMPKNALQWAGIYPK